MMQLTNLKVLMMLLTNLVLKVLVTQLTNLKVLMMLLTNPSAPPPVPPDPAP